MNYDHIWTTADEIRFFRTAKPVGITKLKFLYNYKEALCKRIIWDKINKNVVLSELNKEIIKLKGA